MRSTLLARRTRHTRAATLAAALLAATAAQAASIVGVSPQGEVARAQQVTVRFSDPVVPFGDLRSPDPMTVACEGAVPPGSGRWSNDRAWVWDFAEPLPPGTRCTVRPKPDWKPFGGGELGGATDHVFSTGGPAVLSSQPSGGSVIAEDQYFMLRLSGPAVEPSVVAHAWCEVEGIGERIGVQVVGGAARDELLKAHHVAPADAGRRLIVGCTRPLPNAAAVRLVWGPGIASAANPSVATRVEQRLRYTVRPAFTAEFGCERERASAPCLPIRPLTLHFSAPVSRDLAAQVRLRPASGASPLAPVFDRDDRSTQVGRIAFPTPLPENAAFTVEMPPALVDDAGRALANAGLFPLRVATGEAPPIAKFAAAPFGVVELGDPVLPVTVRHVQTDLRPPAAGAGAPPGGQVRVKRLQTDADILAWYARLKAYDERRISARDRGLPESEWFAMEPDPQAPPRPGGRPALRRVERSFATRELSLLDHDPGATRVALPRLAGGDPRPFEVVGIPLPEPGYHVVEIESLRLGQALLDRRAPMFVRTGVLVTHLAVHFKQGRENSLAWVTTLDRGEPVAGAAVGVDDCTGRRLWSGATDAQGIARIPQALDDAAARNCIVDDGFFVTARKADARGETDTAFVFTGWQKGIEAWRFNLPTGRGAEPDAVATTVFDRTLLRAGETVSMKHFFRLATSAGLANAAPGALPTRLRIVHAGSGETFEQPLVWNGSRSAVSTWPIPPAAKLGVYRVELVRGAGDEPRHREWTSGSFRVEEFRLPLVDARLGGPKAVAIAPAELPLALQLDHLSGGPMANAAVRASAVLKPRAVSFSGYEGFVFEPPRDPQRAAGNSGDEDEEAESGGHDGKLVADKLPLTTDRNGAVAFTLKALPRITRPGEITAEATYRDPNGEAQTVSTTVPVWPSAVVLGVRTGSWIHARGKVKFSALALDTTARPLAGQAVEVRGRRSRTLSTRKRMVGGFYAYDNRTEVDDLGTLCTGKTDARGLLLCEAELDSAGQVELIASAADAAGHPVQAAASVWVTGHGELWFGQDNDDRIDVLPEKRRYEPGETARLQVRMPFRVATALVTVEREGILASRVVTLRGDDPTVELEVGKDWGPNVYVSVLALRGRIRDTPWYSFFTWGWKEPLAWARSFWWDGREYQAPTAMVDLAKPAFKLGVAAIEVAARGHELQVSVTADKPQYAVRQTVTARVKVSFEGKPLAGTEVAFAAVDEGLLALRDNASWNLLAAMVRERAWGVETSTAQNEIIGRRHYGRKAAPAGGGGGRGGTRELFDTLRVWKAAVPLDARGEATIEVPLNDSLTSWRLVAVADDGGQRFGTGSTAVRVTQDLQLLSGLPPLVREGDRFSALLTLRNTTARDMTVRAALHGTAGAATGAASAPLDPPPREVRLAAGAALEVAWPVEAPADAASVDWEASAYEVGGPARDRLKVTQRVSPAVPVQVLQATLQQLDGRFTLPVAAPADALPAGGVKRGGVSIGVQPKLTGALPGLRRYFETYPFDCLEQQVSTSVGLKDATRWRTVANALPTYLDRDGLASYFPPRGDEGAHGSDRLTAYLLAATHEAGFELPAPARDAMLSGLAAFVEGRIERRFWSPRPDLDVRKLAAIEALSRYGRARPAMLDSIAVVPNAWPTAALLDWLGVLQRVDGMPDRARKLDEARRILRARLDDAGTTLRFGNEAGDFWWWLMDSADANAARLVLTVLDDPAWHDEVPRLVVGLLGRQRRGAWLTTTANLWGSLALDKFSARFESAPVAGRTVATLGDRRDAVDWGSSPAGGVLRLAWPAEPGTLGVEQLGNGKPWLTVQSLAAIAPTAPIRAGYAVTRSVTAVEQRDPAGGYSRGDVLRVHLEIDAQADGTWVVVSDPVPGGATLLGTGLGRDASIATAGEKRTGGARPAFEERSFGAYRAYFEFLPKGRHAIDYTVRLDNPGRFALPPTRVEAMYAPESFGELPNAPVEVRP